MLNWCGNRFLDVGVILKVGIREWRRKFLWKAEIRMMNADNCVLIAKTRRDLAGGLRYMKKRGWVTEDCLRSWDEEGDRFLQMLSTQKEWDKIVTKTKEKQNGNSA
jgi:hypothetical protein